MQPRNHANPGLQPHHARSRRPARQVRPTFAGSLGQRRERRRRHSNVEAQQPKGQHPRTAPAPPKVDFRRFSQPEPPGCRLCPRHRARARGRARLLPLQSRRRRCGQRGIRARWSGSGGSRGAGARPLGGAGGRPAVILAQPRGRLSRRRTGGPPCNHGWNLGGREVETHFFLQNAGHIHVHTKSERASTHTRAHAQLKRARQSRFGQASRAVARVHYERRVIDR